MSRSYLTPPSRVISHVKTQARKVRNLAQAAVTVVTTPGDALVPAEVEAARLAACSACPEGRWNPAGNAGLGECQHPDCGCTAYKLKFAALTCPLNPPVWGPHKQP